MTAKNYRWKYCFREYFYYTRRQPFSCFIKREAWYPFVSSLGYLWCSTDTKYSLLPFRERRAEKYNLQARRRNILLPQNGIRKWKNWRWNSLFINLFVRSIHVYRREVSHLDFISFRSHLNSNFCSSSFLPRQNSISSSCFFCFEIVETSFNNAEFSFGAGSLFNLFRRNVFPFSHLFHESWVYVKLELTWLGFLSNENCIWILDMAVVENWVFCLFSTVS